MSIMEDNSVKLVSEGAVSEILINRPKALNALNADVLLGIILTLERLQKSPQLRAIIITGEGEKAFVAGADIHGMADLGPRPIADYIELGQKAMRCIETCRVPVIAALNGFALGGGLELALACDIIFASTLAKLGQPEVNLGIIPGFGGTQRLMQRAGIGAAKRLILTGELISADEAHRIGLIDKIFEPDKLLEGARACANTICEKAPLAVAKAKAILNRTQEQVLLSGLRHEVEGFLDLFATADREEGMQAFMQKRKPAFTSR